MPRKPVAIACNESVAVACEESVHSVAEQNQRLLKAKPFFARCAFALRPKLGICGTQGGSSKWCKKKNILLVDRCPFAYIELWKKAQLPIHGHACTNRPVLCQICLSTTGNVRHYVWSYLYLDHMQCIHPGQKLTEEEVAKYAIHKEVIRFIQCNYKTYCHGRNSRASEESP